MPSKKHKLCSELSDLTQCCRSVRFSDFRTLQQQGKDIAAYCTSVSGNSTSVGTVEML